MRLPAFLLLPFAIAACNSQNNAGSNQVAGNASSSATTPAGATTLRPGRWEMTMRVISLDMPNAPPEMLAQLRAQPMPPPQTTANCMTPEESADLAANFRRQILQNQPNLSCQVGDQQFGAGRIRLSMTCTGQNGQPDQRLAMVGSFTDSSIQVAVSADSSTPVGNGTAQAVRIESTLTGRRVGECNGTEQDSPTAR